MEILSKCWLILIIIKITFYSIIRQTIFNFCKGFECVCENGYNMVDGVCVPECDENQCLNKPCQKRAKCIDKCEGYECECVNPYTLQQGQCCDENQCADEYACPANSECENLCQGHRCNCHEGYHKENKLCVPDCDDDQCDLGPYGSISSCGANSICTNLCHGYECTCLPEYIQDGNGGCKPEDPCMEMTCGAYMECQEGECYCEKLG